MKENRIIIKIRRPVSEVFDFTVTPGNTPKWIINIVEEKTNELPVKLGTIYRIKNKGGVWTEYEVIEFELNKIFTLSQKGTDYKVRYTYKPIENGTELIYFEWSEKGELEDPFSKSILNKLKSVMEQD